MQKLVRLVKNLKMHFFDFFALKKPKTAFWEKLENEAISKSSLWLFLLTKVLFSNAIPSKLLNKKWCNQCNVTTGTAG
jgi:hypothetical protein